MKRVTATVATLMSLLVVAPVAKAEVLGRRHIGIGVGATWVGDDRVDGTSLDLSARIRLPVSRNFDVVAFHGQAMLEGYDRQVPGAPYVKSKSTEYGADLICHFLPWRPADPFIRTGISNRTADTTVDGKPTFADEDIKFKFGGGAEFNINKNLSLCLGLAYQDSFQESYGSDVSAGLSLDGWLNDVLLIGLVAECSSADSGELSASVRASYGF